MSYYEIIFELNIFSFCYSYIFVLIYVSVILGLYLKFIFQF